MSRIVDLYRTLTTHISKVKNVERERALRLYCSQQGQMWTLQVRGPMGTGTFGYGEGKDFVVAGASLTLEDMKALRTSIDEFIKEAEETDDVPNS